MTLRVTDFLRKMEMDADFTASVLEKETGKKLLSDYLCNLKEKSEKSFNPLEGFDNPVWEMQVVNFRMNQYGVAIIVENRKEQE